MTEVRPIRVQPAPPRVLSETEEALLRREAPMINQFILLAVETGLRRRALLSLRWEYLDLQAGKMRLPGELLKSGRELRVPLSQRAWDCLVELKKSSTSELVLPIPASTLGDAWRRACRVCGLTGLKIHDLRKTFLTRCRRRNVPLEVACALSDHRDYRVALGVYRLVDEEDLLRAVRAPEMGAVKEATCPTTT
jgi:integrase